MNINRLHETESTVPFDAVESRCKLHAYALRDAFVHVFGSQSELREPHGLSAERILKEISSDPT